MIQFKDVTKKYGGNEPVLDRINFLIEKGSFAYLVGPTGSGKTTIFRLIIRDLTPTEGTINLAEWDLVSLPKSKIPHLRRKVGVVFQDLKLLPDRTVIENVMLPLEFSGVGEQEARERAQQILEEVGLGHKIDQFPQQLSGGERQRVAIARALVFDPEIILADEPTGNLDQETSFQILELLKNINKKGTTIFMATHNDKLIEETDRVIILEKGKLKEDKNAGKAQKHIVKEDDKEAKHDDEKVEEKKDDKKETDEPEKKGKIKLEAIAKKEGKNG